MTKVALFGLGSMGFGIGSPLDSLQSTIFRCPIKSANWRLKEEVKLGEIRILSTRTGRVSESSPSARSSPVEVALIDQPGDPHLGTGETLQCPTGAAIANTVFDEVGARVTQLQLMPDRVKAAMEA